MTEMRTYTFVGGPKDGETYRDIALGINYTTIRMLWRDDSGATREIIYQFDCGNATLNYVE